MRTKNAKCDVCGKPLNLKGLTNHMKYKHPELFRSRKEETTGYLDPVPQGGDATELELAQERIKNQEAFIAELKIRVDVQENFLYKIIDRLR